jgi:alkaline phosphatase
MRKLTLLLSLSLVLTAAPPKRAKNVILFLADACGTSTLNAASWLGYGEPQKLYVQSWPYMALSDTSPAGARVTDSAAGMTAIVTGVKTRNGVLSQGPDAEKGKKDGTVLKTILEYAEQHGLATGVVSNMDITDATPAACYAHTNSRSTSAEIFQQIFTPRFGDGVDVVLGAGRKSILAAGQKAGLDLEALSAGKQRPLHRALDEVGAAEARPIVVVEKDFDVPAATRLALKTLSKSRQGYFLMVEWDAHTDNPRTGIEAVVGFDKLIREIAAQVDLRDTLILFTADHSFDLREVPSDRDQPLLKGWDEWQASHQTKEQRREEIRLPALRIGHGHTGEEVLATAQGPGSDQLKGFIPNTRLFELMLNAYGWKR